MENTYINRMTPIIVWWMILFPFPLSQKILINWQISQSHGSLTIFFSVMNLQVYHNFSKSEIKCIAWTLIERGLVRLVNDLIVKVQVKHHIFDANLYSRTWLLQAWEKSMTDERIKLFRSSCINCTCIPLISRDIWNWWNNWQKYLPRIQFVQLVILFFKELLKNIRDSTVT